MGESLIKILQQFRGRRDHVLQGCLKVTMELVDEQGLKDGQDGNSSDWRKGIPDEGNSESS